MGADREDLFLRKIPIVERAIYFRQEASGKVLTVGHFVLHGRFKGYHLVGMVFCLVL